MNFKRKKSKRSVRCTLCTPVRWMGNRKGRRKDREKARRDEMERAIAAKTP